MRDFQGTMRHTDDSQTLVTIWYNILTQVWNRSLDENKKRDESKVPNIMKAFPIIKRTEYFTAYTHRNIEARTILLTYFI